MKNFWNNIESFEDLSNVIEISKEHRAVIFKHSTRCFISKSVLKNFENEVENSMKKNISYYLLDLIAFRDISNAISEKFEIRHESPQMIVLENQKVILHASHENISLDLV